VGGGQVAVEHCISAIAAEWPSVRPGGLSLPHRQPGKALPRKKRHRLPALSEGALMEMLPLSLTLDDGETIPSDLTSTIPLS